MLKYTLKKHVLSVNTNHGIVRDHKKILDSSYFPEGNAEELVKSGFLTKLSDNAVKKLVAAEKKAAKDAKAAIDKAEAIAIELADQKAKEVEEAREKAEKLAADAQKLADKEAKEAADAQELADKEAKEAEDAQKLADKEAKEAKKLSSENS